MKKTTDTPPLELLKKAYKKANKKGSKYIVINGTVFYVPYLKYLIEYVELKDHSST